MIKDIKNIIKVFFALSVGAILFTSCDPEADGLGTQFFQNGIATGTEESYPVIAYNLNHNDTIRTDAVKLVQATLGAFDESNFGMQKSSYVTQMRLSSYSPDFGVNAKVDSVVLQLKPRYHTASDSIKTNTYDEGYLYPDGNVPAKKVVTNYLVAKYGRTKINGQTSFTIKVHEVADFLNASTDEVRSNKKVALGALLATKTFDGYVRSIKITKDSDNSELFSRDVGLRIPLDATFFQQKIIDKKGSFELSDAASFIRYFKGIRISVEENDGYIFGFNPNEITAIIYYKYDKDGTTRTSATYTLDFGAANVHYNEIDYTRPSGFISNINSTAGDEKLYVQGMGGPGTEIKIPASEIEKLKTLYNNNKIGILSAKVRLYTDESVWKGNYPKPTSLIALLKGTKDFLEDFKAFQYNTQYAMVKPVNLDKNPAYYEIDITQTITNTIKNRENDYLEKNPLVIDVGSFRVNTASSSSVTYLGYNYTDRAYTPNRVVLLGSNVSSSNAQYNNRAQLKVIYSKK